MNRSSQSNTLRIQELTLGGETEFAALISGHEMFSEYGMDAEWLANSLRGALEREEPVLIAYVAGTPAGLVWFLTEGTFHVGGYVRLLVVASSLAGEGVGSALMDAAEAHVFTARQDLFLLVNTNNLAAQRFYSRRGYQRVGELKGFAAPGVDEYIFHKRQLMQEDATAG